MGDDAQNQEIQRANIRLLLQHDKKYNATSFAKVILGRGKDYLNDYLTQKDDGTYKKVSLGGMEFVKLLDYFCIPAEKLQRKALSEIEAGHLVKRAEVHRGHYRQIQDEFQVDTDNFDALRGDWGTGKTQNLIKSFDPDEAEDADHDSRIRIVGETESSPRDRPSDAINELLSRAGLGDGEEVELAWERDGDGHKQVDAIRDDYWRFPKTFLQRDLRRAASQLIVIECEGDSMEPTIVSGARVVVDTHHVAPTPDGIYAIRDRFGAIRIKRLQVALSGQPKVRVICDNPAHVDEEMPLSDITVIGRVVGAIRTF